MLYRYREAVIKSVAGFPEFNPCPGLQGQPSCKYSVKRWRSPVTAGLGGK
jgi:hypothetical protein